MSDLREAILSHLRGDAMINYVATLGYQPRRTGGEYKILCPFHNDSKPSFTINTRKRDSGIFKCFSCHWGGDIFDFVQELHGFEDWIKTAKFIAGQLGIGERVEAGRVQIQKREVQKQAPAVELMTSAEVFAVYQEYKAAAMEVEPWAEHLGVDARAFALVGAVVAPYRTSPDRTVLVVPMRTPDGAMCSLRFRCFDTKRRWSLDVKERRGREWEQIKCSQSGLLVVPDQIDPDYCLEGLKTIIIEGETDLLGGMTLLLRDYGDDPTEWPARFVALPGVGSCHDMVLSLAPSSLTVTLFDRDAAGMTAVFNHRRQRKGKDGRMVLDLDTPAQPGLLAKMQEKGWTARAAFPPRAPDGSKFDLRDMAKAGWTWHQLYTHLVSTATADPAGRRFRRTA